MSAAAPTLQEQEADLTPVQRGNLRDMMRIANSVAPSVCRHGSLAKLARVMNAPMDTDTLMRFSSYILQYSQQQPEHLHHLHAQQQQLHLHQQLLLQQQAMQPEHQLRGQQQQSQQQREQQQPVREQSENLASLPHLSKVEARRAEEVPKASDAQVRPNYFQLQDGNSSADMSSSAAIDNMNYSSNQQLFITQ